MYRVKCVYKHVQHFVPRIALKRNIPITKWRIKPDVVGSNEKIISLLRYLFKEMFNEISH